MTTFATTADREREAEGLAREFARVYPTPNVQRAIALCEAGTLQFSAVAALFARSFSTAREQIENGGSK